MATERTERRLAGILAADVVGYSALIKADEAGTRRRFNAHLHELIEPAIAARNGRIVKTTGDGLLAEFASVVDAVECAAEIQNAMPGRNADEPDGRRIIFRIGVNLGDIIVEGDDIHGEGVNIAARLEGLAEPGGILISEDVWRQARGKVDLAFEDLGEDHVKNISQPVRAYRVTLEGAAAPDEDAVTLELPDRPSIAVLPFDNMSGDPAQGYFGDGLTETLIAELAQISGLFVIARNSTFVYKDRAVDVRTIARELGVRYVLEGSFQRAGSRVRITAQLIDAIGGHHMWADRYDRDFDDIFDVQDEITGKIVSALDVTLKGEEQLLLTQRRLNNPAAAEPFFRGYGLFQLITREDTAASRPNFERAAELDPESSFPLEMLGWTYVQEARFGWTDDPAGAFRRAAEYAEKALAVGSESSGPYSLMGNLLLLRGEHDKAVALGRRAVALAPNLAITLALLAQTLLLSDEPVEAIGLVKQAMRLDPHFPPYYHYFLGSAHQAAGDHEAAIGEFKTYNAKDPHSTLGLAQFAESYAETGDTDAARSTIAELLQLDPAYTLRKFAQGVPFKDRSILDHMIATLRDLGLPE